MGILTTGDVWKFRVEPMRCIMPMAGVSISDTIIPSNSTCAKWYLCWGICTGNAALGSLCRRNMRMHLLPTPKPTMRKVKQGPYVIGGMILSTGQSMNRRSKVSLSMFLMSMTAHGDIGTKQGSTFLDYGLWMGGHTLKGQKAMATLSEQKCSKVLQTGRSPFNGRSYRLAQAQSGTYLVQVWSESQHAWINVGRDTAQKAYPLFTKLTN